MSTMLPTISQVAAALGLGLATFVAAAAYDYVEAYLTRSTVDLHPHKTARLSVAMYAISCVGWFVTIKVSLWYMVPEVLGLYLGSWCAVERQRRQAAWEAARAQALAPLVASRDGAATALATSKPEPYSPDDLNRSEETAPCPSSAASTRDSFPMAPATWN